MEAMGDNIRVFYFLFEKGGRESCAREVDRALFWFDFAFMDFTGCAGKDMSIGMESCYFVSQHCMPCCHRTLLSPAAAVVAILLLSCRCTVTRLQYSQLHAEYSTNISANSGRMCKEDEDNWMAVYGPPPYFLSSHWKTHWQIYQRLSSQLRPTYDVRREGLWKASHRKSLGVPLSPQTLTPKLPWHWADIIYTAGYQKIKRLWWPSSIARTQHIILSIIYYIVAY